MQLYHVSSIDQGLINLSRNCIGLESININFTQSFDDALTYGSTFTSPYINYFLIFEFEKSYINLDDIDDCITSIYINYKAWYELLLDFDKETNPDNLFIMLGLLSHSKLKIIN